MDMEFSLSADFQNKSKKNHFIAEVAFQGKHQSLYATVTEPK